jgi:hypothetical protein
MDPLRKGTGIMSTPSLARLRKSKVVSILRFIRGRNAAARRYSEEKFSGQHTIVVVVSDMPPCRKKPETRASSLA